MVPRFLLEARITQTYNLTVANLAQVSAAGVSYQLTLVPAQSTGGSTKPFRFLMEEELCCALFSLDLAKATVENVLQGLKTDGFYWLPGLSLSDEQREKFGLVTPTHV